MIGGRPAGEAPAAAAAENERVADQLGDPGARQRLNSVRLVHANARKRAIVKPTPDEIDAKF
jgi:hypothetical protein